MTAILVDHGLTDPATAGGHDAVLRTEDGTVLDAPADRWFRAAEPAEARALVGVRRPALDIGCARQPVSPAAELRDRGGDSHRRHLAVVAIWLVARAANRRRAPDAA